MKEKIFVGHRLRGPHLFSPVPDAPSKITGEHTACGKDGRSLPLRSHARVRLQCIFPTGNVRYRAASTPAAKLSEQRCKIRILYHSFCHAINQRTNASWVTDDSDCVGRDFKIPSRASGRAIPVSRVVDFATANSEAPGSRAPVILRPPIRGPCRHIQPTRRRGRKAKSR